MSEDARKATTWGTRVGVGLLSAFLLSGLYFGAYWVAVDHHSVYIGEGINDAEPIYRWEKDGYFPDAVGRRFFRPAHLIDRSIRRKDWSTW